MLATSAFHSTMCASPLPKNSSIAPMTLYLSVQLSNQQFYCTVSNRQTVEKEEGRAVDRSLMEWLHLIASLDV